MAAAVNWSGTRSTVALTNGNKELPKGPAHRRETSGGGGCSGGRRRTLLSAEDWARTKLTLTSSRLPSALICDPGLFWAPLTQLATPQTQTMFPVKVKVEKSGEDPESWRWPRPGTNLMLFCSVCWRRVTWTALETPSPQFSSVPGSVWRRKLGKPPQTPTTRIVPLQPLANGHPPASPTSGGRRGGRWMTGWLREAHSDPSSEVTNSKSRDVYKLPPPTAPGPPGDACRSRIPSPLQPETQGTPDDEPSEPEPSPSTLIYRNMQRWKRIRQRWKEASHRNQLRYSESMKILREMYERQ
ncbi:protein lin-37 homolog isoform X4 [Leptonychotes weddellii]|uniref:Protein lin-37 homolog isoform X4 n=1 Tax=Leptonychotes weddellii TaxID=9713 RepID=A0A7F8RN31_LEPWE|nr:protein lin-37 homolog isoform X4 [Leptonychotes weddellii]